MPKRTMLALGVVLTVGMAYAAPEHTTTLKDQQAVVVTIYNENLALVKDTRKVQLAGSENRLAWRDVSACIRPETALLRNLTHTKGFYLIEQNFDFDLLTPQKLLEKYIGQTVTIIRTHPTTGVDTREEAPVTVKVIEPIPGDWQMLSASAPHKKEASNTAVWNVTVPANGKTTLDYKVRVRY